VNGSGGMAALRPGSRALLRRARRGAADDPRALAVLRDDLARLSEDELSDLWDRLDDDGASADETDSSPDDAHEHIHGAVARARRKLLVSAERFRGMLIDHIARHGGAPAPDAASRSLKALVAAFCDAGRGDELAAAAAAIVKARSFAYDFT
jgi:hypothetical protein